MSERMFYAVQGTKPPIYFWQRLVQRAGRSDIRGPTRKEDTKAKHSRPSVGLAVLLLYIFSCIHFLDNSDKSWYAVSCINLPQYNVNVSHLTWILSLHYLAKLKGSICGNFNAGKVCVIHFLSHPRQRDEQTSGWKFLRLLQRFNQCLFSRENAIFHCTYDIRAVTIKEVMQLHWSCAWRLIISSLYSHCYIQKCSGNEAFNNLEIS